MPERLKVLVVEDQAAVANALSVLFDVHDIPCVVARSPAEAGRIVAAGGIGVVVQDMNFSPGATSGEEGAALFSALRRTDPEMPVILMTAWTALATAVRLVREGASDYLAKPWDDAKLLRSVQNLLAMRTLAAENERLRRATSDSRAELARKFDLAGIVYESEAMHRAVLLAVQVARADVSILITGPNGSGKERIAELIHANSSRRGKPLVKVNAGALPDELLQAELFGAEAGAFTGAAKLRVGRFEAADGGTLFLDEIGTLSLSGQVKLLRVLQNQEFERLGSSETRRVNVRVLCATNANLLEAIARGGFREDLFFRLNVIEVEVPSLKDRVDDVLPIARAALAALLPSDSGKPFTLTREAERALEAHSWPGNVRELLNRLQRAALVTEGDALTPEDLGFADVTPRAASERPAVTPLRTAAEDAERGELQRALVEHGGSVSRAAAALGLSRQALYRRMERLGVVLERRPRGSE